MPSTARTALQMAKDPEASFGGIGAVLETDPVLTAQLLKLANSPMYGGSRKISGIRQALVRVGLRGFCQLLMLASMSKMFRVDGDPRVTTNLQQHATATAIAAEAVATLVHVDRDAAFTAGVLHDIGIPMAYGLMAACRRYLPREVAASPKRQAEAAAALHQELGAYVARHWGLPSETQAAIGHHHAPASAPPRDQALAWVVAAAGDVVHRARLPGVEDGEECGMDAVMTLGLTDAQVDDLAAKTRHRLGLAPR